MKKDIWKEKIWNRIPERWKQFRRSRTEAYIAASETEINYRIKNQILKECKLGVIVLCLLVFCLMGAVISHFVPRKSSDIQRNEAGDGESTQQVTIDVNGEKFEYELPVSEKIYSKKETEAVFEDGFQYLEKEMLNGNVSLNEIRSDVNFLWEIPGNPLEITWNLEDESVIDLDGKVYNEKMEKGSKPVHVLLTLGYRDFEKEKVYTLTVYPRQISPNQKKAEEILREIKKIENKNRTSLNFQIPSVIKNADIQIGKQKNGWLILSGLIAIFGILLIARQLEQEDQQRKNVKKASELEYSNILWQFVLLLEAGFTIQMAWKKIVSDYEKRKDKIPDERRYVYEQMSYSYHQMELGYSLEEIFQLFSRKMAIRSYSKLMTLFLQNVTKGSKKMLDLLKTEENQAFRNRCEQAKQMGEEADTKLLLPMGIMLLNILLMLMVPAYLQF